MAQFDRRYVLRLGAGAIGAAWLRPALANDAGTKNPWPFGIRRTEISRGFPPFRLRQCRCAQGRAVFAARRRRRIDLQFAQRLHPQGRHRERHGPDFRVADDAGAGRAGRGVSPGSAGPDGFFRRVALPLSAAPRDHVSRRHRHHRGRRRLLAEHAEDQGASGLFLGVARARRSRGRGQADRHLAVLAGPRARCAGAGGVDADLLGKILRRTTVRRDLARGAARLRSLPRGALRAGPLRRIRAGQELVGRKSSRRARTV